MAKNKLTDVMLGILNESYDDPITKEDLDSLKKIYRLIPKQELINWYNENDIDYYNWSDMEMYIKYIEHELN